jgi:multidrug efflux pump subunit AcrA (membrane-fusion protein)
MSLQSEVKSTEGRLKASVDHGDQVLNNARDEVQLQKKQLEHLRKQLEAENAESAKKYETLEQLETQLSTLTAGNEDQIAKENAIATQREQALRELENRRRTEITALEDKKKAMETKAKQEIGRLRSDYKKTEEEESGAFNKLRKGLEVEIDSLSRELADIKSRYAKEITAANITAENCKKVCEEAVRRMAVAEDLANSMQAEVTEAKEVAQFNAQLTKDLNREQLTRKKLHNEMEDMKGKIRVYVRVRPLSKSEVERQCQVCAHRDSKTSLIIKNSDGSTNKSFEFDQVFAGKEGNNQVDIFRDTKHLVMSVLDGFNVCIFAYGQTGAGKSYTMIGAADIGNCLRENGDFDDSAGITPRAVSELFRLLNERTAQMSYVVRNYMHPKFGCVFMLYVVCSGGSTNVSVIPR